MRCCIGGVGDFPRQNNIELVDSVSGTIQPVLYGCNKLAAVPGDRRYSAIASCIVRLTGLAQTAVYAGLTAEWQVTPAKMRRATMIPVPLRKVRR